MRVGGKFRAMSIAAGLAVGMTTMMPALPALAARAPAPIETFSQPDEVWAEGSTHGPFRVVFNGYGAVGIVNQRMRLSPAAASQPDETHAALVVANTASNDTNLGVVLRPTAQLRTGSTPNTWETGWVVWNYVSNNQFWYFLPKPNGWELGRVDPVLGQVFVATGESPTTPIGASRAVRVRHVRDRITITMDGATVVDRRNVVTTKTNTVGFYTEDATVDFDDVSLN